LILLQRFIFISFPTTLSSEPFKATFKDEPLEEVLRLIAITTPIKYVIEKRDSGADGILKRKKVTIELKK
jgi:hypothetical protein